MTILGIDIGATRTKAARIDEAGNILSRKEVATEYESARLIQSIERIVAEFAEPHSPVGISAPGLASRDNSAIAWMRGRLEVVEGLAWSDVLGREVVVLNDGHAATLAEAWVGAAADAQNALMIVLGTGVGGGVILNGELLQGATGRAGHFGHVSVDAWGPPDIVLTPGSLEDWIGSHNVANRTLGRFENTHELVSAASQGEPAAVKWWGQSIDALAAAVGSLINAFDPEVIVIGGGIAKCGDALFKPLEASVAALEWRPFGSAVPVLPAKLREYAGCVGAAKFALTNSGKAVLG